jgi:nucleotide-binding universal stress UspA family protein
VTLVSVLEPPLLLPSSYLPDTVSEEKLAGEHEAAVSAHLEKVRARLVAEGVADVAVRVLEGGDVVGSVVDFAAEAEVDLVALASTGRGGVERLFVGSVADKLIRSAEQALLVTPRARK